MPSKVIRAVVAGQAEVDIVAWPDDPENGVPEYAMIRRDATLDEYGYVARALGDDFIKLMKVWESLPSDIRILARLRDAATQATQKLKDTVKKIAACILLTAVENGDAGRSKTTALGGVDIPLFVGVSRSL